MRESKIDKVIALVQQNGGWESIFSNYTGLRYAMEKSSGGRSVQVPCPRNNKGTTKFRLFKDWETTGGGYHNEEGALIGGIDVIAFMENCSKAQALDKIIDMCGGDLSKVTDAYAASVKASTPKGPSDEDVAKRRANLNKLYRNAVPASMDSTGCIQRYLNNRGLQTDARTLPLTLGFTDKLWWGNGESKPVKYWGMLGMMTDMDGQNVTIHRTFLTPDGKKAPVEKPKMLMSPPTYIGGCSIKIDQPLTVGDNTFIGLCEGIETALAIREATGTPMWSCYSDSLLELVKIPQHVDTVIIFADKDRSEAGQSKAQSLAKRLRSEGRHVDVYVPQQEIPEGDKSIDWLDVYTRFGASAFPYHLDNGISVTTGVAV